MLPSCPLAWLVYLYFLTRKQCISSKHQWNSTDYRDRYGCENLKSKHILLAVEVINVDSVNEIELKEARSLTRSNTVFSNFSEPDSQEKYGSSRNAAICARCATLLNYQLIQSVFLPCATLRLSYTSLVPSVIINPKFSPDIASV